MSFQSCFWDLLVLRRADGLTVQTGWTIMRKTNKMHVARRHAHLCLSSDMKLLKSSHRSRAPLGTVCPFCFFVCFFFLAQRQCFIYLPIFETSIYLPRSNDSILPSRSSRLWCHLSGLLIHCVTLQSLAPLSAHLFFFYCYLFYLKTSQSQNHSANWKGTRICKMWIVMFCSCTVVQPYFLGTDC